MSRRFLLLAICLPLAAQVPADSPQARADALKARIEATPELPFTISHFAAQPANPGWESGMVSWVAVDKMGKIFELQRGEKADPVLILDKNGKLLRSFGKGNYQIPHSIRLDPAGNIWTVDAQASRVIKYSPTGEKLGTIEVGEQPKTNSAFNGTTDIAFGPNGRLFISDGYGNARVLEYSSDGKRVAQWGKPGTGPGEFKLPHSIQIDEKGILYVADRENGRIQKFTMDGKFISEIAGLGRTYSLRLVGKTLWAGMQQLNEPTGSPGWLVKFDRDSGKMLGHIKVPEKGVLHSVAETPGGELLTNNGNQVIWFRKKK